MNHPQRKKEDLIQWIKNHPDVWHTNLSPTQAWWYVQNCLGSLGIFEWDYLAQVPSMFSSSRTPQPPQAEQEEKKDCNGCARCVGENVFADCHNPNCPCHTPAEKEQKRPEQVDDLYPFAVAIVKHENKASASLLQRKLKIGYARSALLLDLMEENGVITPPDGYIRKVIPESPTPAEQGKEEWEDSFYNKFNIYDKRQVLPYLSWRVVKDFIRQILKAAEEKAYVNGHKDGLKMHITTQPLGEAWTAQHDVDFHIKEALHAQAKRIIEELEKERDEVQKRKSDRTFLETFDRGYGIALEVASKSLEIAIAKIKQITNL